MSSAKQPSGQVVAIYIARKQGAPVEQVQSVQAIAGVGLDGDRNARKPNETKAHQPDHELTLIEAESIEALFGEAGIELEPGDARRNIVTRGLRLNDLVDREFSIGEVCVRGLRLCHPCEHLEKLTARGVKAGLANRGGLRAQILSSGTIRSGEPITTPLPQRSA